MIRALFVRGNQAANTRVDQWVRAHYDAVFRFAARRAGDDLAADITQETFIVATRKHADCPNDDLARSFLMGIALRCSQNALRKKKRESSIDWIDDQAVGGPDLLEATVLRQAIQKLSDDHRLVVQLHELEGLSYGEIAAILEVPEGTVKSRLYYAFVELRRHLSGVRETQ